MISQDWISKIIGFLSGSAVTILAILYILITNPNKIEKWASNIYKFGAYISKRSEKQYMATNIQSSIEEKRKKLGAEGDVLSYGIQIKWTEEESAEIDLKENRVIVMMRPFRSQSKNLANVVSLYVPKALLPQSRRYVDPNLITGLDYTISKTLLESNPPALTYYIEEEKEKITDDVKSLLDLIDPIHSIGHLSRVLVPEYQSLSGLHPIEPNANIQKETVDLLKHIHYFETFEPGTEEERSGIFIREYIKMTMVPVGKAHKLALSGTEKHLKFIKEQLEEGIEHFYIVSAGISNPFAKELVKNACKECELSLIFAEEYEGIFRRRKRKMYCALCTKEKLS